MDKTKSSCSQKKKEQVASSQTNMNNEKSSDKKKTLPRIDFLQKILSENIFFFSG